MMMLRASRPLPAASSAAAWSHRAAARAGSFVCRPLARQSRGEREPSRRSVMVAPLRRRPPLQTTTTSTSTSATAAFASAALASATFSAATVAAVCAYAALVTRPRSRIVGREKFSRFSFFSSSTSSSSSFSSTSLTFSPPPPPLPPSTSKNNNRPSSSPPRRCSPSRAASPTSSPLCSSGPGPSPGRRPPQSRPRLRFPTLPPLPRSSPRLPGPRR